MFRDPNRLQSEEYLLRQQALEILYKKDISKEIVDIVTETPRIEIDKRSQEHGK
jgi:siroheme synthase